MGYLFSAYAVIWGLLAGYIFLLGKRQQRLQKEIDMLKEWKEDDE